MQPMEECRARSQPGCRMLAHDRAKASPKFDPDGKHVAKKMCAKQNFSSALSFYQKDIEKKSHSLPELGDPMGKARNFAAGVVLVNDAALRRTHDDRFGLLESQQCRIAVAAGDRFLDFADRFAQQRTARLV